MTKPPTGAKYPAGSEYPTGPLFVRMRVYQTGWTSPQYDAQQILSMITQLHPDVLERMTYGTFSVTASVPVCSACAPMDYGQFLNASMQACGCYIIPRLDINATWDEGTFLSDAQQILATNVSPRFSILSIDNWSAFCAYVTCNCAFDQQVFQPLYAMGWKGVGVLDGTDYVSACGWATYADFTSSGNLNVKLLDSLKADTTLQKILMYDPDFPTPAQNFLASCDPTCDSAVASLQTAVSGQAANGYSYVYPIEQTFWDANNITTSASGVYHGQTLYNIFLSWIKEYD